MAAVAVGEEYRCFVGGLAWATDDSRLEDAFKPFGQVIETKVVNDRETGRSRGFGFVTFSDEQSMRDAIQSLDGSELDGRNITVNQAQSRSNGGGGNYRSGGDRNGGGYGNNSRYGNSGGSYRSGGDTRGSRGGGYGNSRESGYGGPRGGSYGGNRDGMSGKSWRSSKTDEY